MNNSPSTHALWQLTRELLELGVEMNLNKEQSELYSPFEYFFHNILKLFNPANKIQMSSDYISSPNILRILCKVS